MVMTRGYGDDPPLSFHDIPYPHPRKFADVVENLMLMTLSNPSHWYWPNPPHNIVAQPHKLCRTTQLAAEQTKEARYGVWCDGGRMTRPLDQHRGMRKSTKKSTTAWMAAELERVPSATLVRQHSLGSDSPKCRDDRQLGGIVKSLVKTMLISS
jgi:hypothetical protein